MFDAIFEAIEVWMRTLLTTMVTSNLQNMFTDVNEKTGEIATQVGQTPQGWNSGIFNMIHNLSNSVIIPIAGMIITFVMCYELISMLTEKNNMHDIDTWMFFKYVFKMMIAVYLLSNTFNITMAVFDLGQHVVNSAAGVISHDTAIDTTQLLTSIETAMVNMELGPGDPAGQLWHEDHVHCDHDRLLRANDRDLSLYFGSTDPVCHPYQP